MMMNHRKKESKAKPSIAIIGVKGMPSRVDGLEVYVEEICSRLADEYTITVFCRKRYCDSIVDEYKGINVIHVPSINTKHLDAVSYGFFATVLGILRGYDLLWYQAMGSAVWEWLPAIFHIKILSTVHGLDWKRERFGKLSSKMVQLGEKMIARYSTKIIVLNNQEAKHFLSKWERKCMLINNGVIIPEKNKESMESKYYLFASRIAPEKDVKTLIRAYNSVSTVRKLMIAGKGTHTKKYEEEVKELASSNDNIILKGYVVGKELDALYQGAYAYILPSTIEGQSIGLLEAMSYELPCIVSDIPENLQVINNCGYIFKKGDSGSLADVLMYFENHEEEIKETGRRARRLVESKYSIEHTVDMTKSVINETLKWKK